MKVLGKWMIALAVIIVIVGGLVLYKVLDIRAEKAATENQPEYSESVESATAEVIAFQPKTQVLGEVIAPQKVELRNELAGRVQAVNFVSGERVTKGQLLIQMDISSELAELKSAEARAELAKATNKRIARLRNTNAVSEERYDQTLADLRVAEADIALLKATIEKKTLRAPFDAQTGIHQLEAGQYLEENTFVTTLVGELGYMWVDFSLPQFYAVLPMASKVQVLLAHEGEAAADAPTFDGEIVARDAIVSSEARSLYYRAKVTLQDGVLIPNTVVSVKVPTAAAQQKIAVPSVSVLYSAAGPYVYRLIPEEATGGFRAKLQPVELGAEVNNYLIIESGLERGALVAAAGAFKLSEGLLAYLANPAAAVSSATDSAIEAL